MNTQTHPPAVSPVYGGSFQFTSEGGEEELVTVTLLGQDVGEQEVHVLGHMAVPLQRVEASGKEEGWYEVRDRTGAKLAGSGGDTGLMVVLTVAPANPAAPRFAGSASIMSSQDKVPPKKPSVE